MSELGVQVIVAALCVSLSGALLLRAKRYKGWEFEAYTLGGGGLAAGLVLAFVIVVINLGIAQ